MRSRLAGATWQWSTIGLLTTLGLFPARASAEFSARQFPVLGLAAQDDAAPAGPSLEPRPLVIELNNGTRLAGTLTAETGTHYLLHSPELGELAIDKADVRRLHAPDAPLGPPAPAPVPPPTPARPAAKPQEPTGLFRTQLLAGWKKNLALGFTGKSGNADSLDLYGKFSGDYDDDERRWRLRAAYFYGLAEANRTKNEGFASVRRDWLLSASPAFYWFEGRTDYNEFKNWRTRLGAFAGVGYEFYKTDALTVLGRVGGGGSYELGDVQEFIPEALISAEANWKLTENQTITFLNTLFPDLDDRGEFRNFTETAWTIKVDAARGLSLKLGLQNEYDSYTADNSQHNDLTYFGALVLDF